MLSVVQERKKRMASSTTLNPFSYTPYKDPKMKKMEENFSKNNMEHNKSYTSVRLNNNNNDYSVSKHIRNRREQLYHINEPISTSNYSLNSSRSSLTTIHNSPYMKQPRKRYGLRSSTLYPKKLNKNDQGASANNAISLIDTDDDDEIDMTTDSIDLSSLNNDDNDQTIEINEHDYTFKKDCELTDIIRIDISNSQTFTIEQFEIFCKILKIKDDYQFHIYIGKKRKRLTRKLYSFRFSIQEAVTIFINDQFHINDIFFMVIRLDQDNVELKKFHQDEKSRLDETEELDDVDQQQLVVDDLSLLNDHDHVTTNTDVAFNSPYSSLSGLSGSSQHSPAQQKDQEDQEKGYKASELWRKNLIYNSIRIYFKNIKSFHTSGIIQILKKYYLRSTQMIFFTKKDMTLKAFDSNYYYDAISIEKKKREKKKKKKKKMI